MMGEVRFPLLDRTLDRIFWPLQEHQQKISVAALLSAASASMTAAAILGEPYNRFVPLVVGMLVVGLYYLATQSWERKEAAHEDRQDAIVKEAVQEYTDRHRKPGYKTGSTPALGTRTRPSATKRGLGVSETRRVRPGTPPTGKAGR